MFVQLVRLTVTSNLTITLTKWKSERKQLHVIHTLYTYSEYLKWPFQFIEKV